LEPIEITGGPSHLIPVALSPLIIVVFVELLRDVQPLDVLLQKAQLLPFVKSMKKDIGLLLYLILLWLVQNTRYRSIHDSLLINVLDHVFLILLAEDGVNVLGIDVIGVVEPLKMLLIIQNFTRY
jgi:hypothetical protein